jgi:deoxyribodipyrimidine photo-lyase
MARKRKAPEPPPFDPAAARLSIAHDVAPKSGAFVLYWLRALRRAEDNLALDHAVARANELGLPLVVYESVDPRAPFASARVHTFVLQSALERRATLEAKGVADAFYLPASAEQARTERPLLKLCAQAALVVTDWFAPSGAMSEFWTEIPRAIGARCSVRVELVDDGILEASLCKSDERSARAPRLREVEWPFEPAQFTAETIASQLERCAIDHAIGAVATTPGTRVEARRRLARFIDERLLRYDSHRNDMGTRGSSELSAHLHFGVISARSVAHAARASGAPEAAREAFIEELIVRRALAFNHTMTTAGHDQYERAVPPWAQATLEAHKSDPRAKHTFDDFERAHTSDPLWNAAQRELLRDGVIQPYARMLWGKVALELAPSPKDAFDWLVTLNDKWALDGRDPNTYTNIAWCFGQHDHRYPERAIFGTVRCMTSRAAKTKWDTEAYVRRVTR